MSETEQILRKLIPQIAEEHNFGSYELQVEPISTGGAHYTTNLFNVTIKEGGNTHHLFAKVAALGEKMREQSPKFYYTEIVVYTELLKIYENLENEHQVPLEHRLKLTKFYGCNPKEYEETVVLENLALKGYQDFDRFKSIDWKYAAATMTELAKFHALSFAYSEYYPEDFQKTVTDFKLEWKFEGGPLEGYFKTASGKAISTVEEDIGNKLKKFFEKFGPQKFMEYFQSCKKPALAHGDFKPSNLMHKIRDDGTLDIKIVDLQAVQGASPTVDIINFIFTGSDDKFRAKYFEKLLDHYYTELQAAMKRLHLVPEKTYSRAMFDEEIKEKLPFGLTISVFTLPLLTVTAEDAPKIDKDLDISTLAVDKTSDRYTELLIGVVNDYIKWGLLK